MYLCRNRQINFLFIVASVFVFLYSTAIFIKAIGTFWGPGWDFMMGCDAARAFLEGKNPYLPASYQFSTNHYTYPFTLLPFSVLLCKSLAIHDLHKVYAYFPAYWIITAFVLYRAITISRGKDMAPMFCFTMAAAFGGLIWTMKTGNYSFFEFDFLVLSLAYLMRGLSPNPKQFDLILFSILFGLFCSIKSVSLIFTPLFFLLPLLPKQKLKLSAIAVIIGAFPILVSASLYPDYFSLQILNTKLDQVGCNPSLYCMFKSYAASAGAENEHAVSMALATFLASALMLLLSLRIIGVFRKFRNMDNETAFRAFVLFVFLGEALLPRLKEYAFVLFAVLLAFYLLSRRKIDLTSLAAIGVSMIPILVNHAEVGAENIYGGYVQLMSTWAVFFILLSDFAFSSDASHQEQPLSPS